MSVLSSIVTVLKVLAKRLGINARTRQTPSILSTGNKYSKSGGAPPPNRDETAPGKTEPDLPRLPGTDNKGESLGRHAGLSEDQDPIAPFDGDLLSTVTKADSEIDTSDPADSGLDADSSDSSEIHRPSPGSTVDEPNSPDVSIKLPGVPDEGRSSMHDRIPDSDDPDGNADFVRTPKVPRKPRNISGRRSRVQRSSSNEPRVSRIFRPELLCYQKQGKWEVVLSVDEQSTIKAVYWQDNRLGVPNNERHILIPSLKGRLVIEYQDGEKQDVTLFKDNPLIFKLRKDRVGGRKIAAITSGYFIVFAPKEWDRTGHVPVEPAGCGDKAFRAHFFYLEAQSPGGHIGGFREWGDFRAANGIKLSGQPVFDDSEEGNLFVQSAPELIATQDIVWARVGKEAESGWKGQNFEPAKQRLSEILDGREGRFFLRIYDSSVNLLDSTTFRFVRGLKQICVNGEPYTKDTILLPDLNGHPYTEVHFVGADDSSSPQITLCEGIHATVKSSILAVDRSPEANRVLCTLGSRNNGVKIELDLPRTWWKMVSSGRTQCEWRDTPFKMTRQEFQKHAYDGAEIKLLQTRLDSIRVGFDDELDQEFRHSKGEFTIPLSDFAYHVQIDQILRVDAQFKVELGGKALKLIVISADPLPEIKSFTASPMRIFNGKEAILRWVTREANQTQVTITPGIGLVESEGHCIVRPTETTAYTLSLVASDTYRVERSVTVNVDLSDRSTKNLRPRARRHNGSGWRNAKGFSHNEVRRAGMTLRNSHRRSIQIDTRRRTVHQINVQALKSLFNEED